MTRALIRIAAGVGLLYLTACGLGVALQDRFVYHPSTAVVEPSGENTSVVLIETEDGETLRAWWRPPEPGQPVLLYLSGNASRPEIEVGRWRRIAAHGAGFLAVCYRGYSGSTGRPSERGLHLDARAAYEWLTDHGVSPDDLVIHGFSLGTGPATRLAAEREARALVLEAPYTALEDLILQRAPLMVWSPLIRSRFRSRDWITDVDEPVLIVHGDSDTVIPVAHGEALFEMAREPKRFVRMHGSDHATLTRDGLYDQIWAFLEDTADPPAGSASAEADRPDRPGRRPTAH